MKKSIGLAISVLALASTAAMADGLEVYGNAGVPQVGVGVGYGINERITVRSDFSTAFRYSKDFHYRSFDYNAKFKNDKLNMMVDYFPFESNGFRLTGGLGLGNTKLTATGHSDAGEQSFKVGGKEYKVNLDGSDTLDAETKYPAVSPYLGIGWGHDVKRKNKGQWSFTADLGMYLGNPKTTVSINSSLREKLIESQLGTQTREEATAELDSRIEQEKHKIEDKVEKFKVVPVLMLGVTYRF